MHSAFAFRLALAAFFCRAAFTGEEPAVEKKARAATQIYVRTAPPGAAVRLDGKDEGTAPGIFVVPPGATKMTVEVELDGVRESRVIEVRGGKITRVEFELGKEGAQPGSNARIPVSASLGPTLEYVLPDPERRHAELFDMDTGAFATMEEFGADDRATHKWVRDHGMDALGVIEKGTAGVLLFDVATIDVPPDRWGAITLQEIADHKILKQKEPDKITPVTCEPSSPVPTCIFRTREGSLGVLQVLGESETPKGVKIRYRLARVPGGASSEQPDPRARRFVRLVVGDDAMTFQGTRASWEELPRLLEAVPDRGRTVLELAAASAGLPVARINEAMARLQPLVQQLGFEYLSLVGVQPLESKGTSAVSRGRLDFRLAPMREEGKMLGLTEGDIERYTAEFKAKGPLPVTYGKDPFVWCRLAKGVAPHVRGISAEREGRMYVLLSNRPAETMLTLFGDSNPWRLLDAVLDERAPDRPSIALRLDREGGWRMGVLTEAHVGLPMAALVDDEVLSLPTVRAKVGDAIVITGAFTREEMTELVERLKGGVSR